MNTHEATSNGTKWLRRSRKWTCLWTISSNRTRKIPEVEEEDVVDEAEEVEDQLEAAEDELTRIDRLLILE